MFYLSLIFLYTYMVLSEEFIEELKSRSSSFIGGPLKIFIQRLSLGKLVLNGQQLENSVRRHYLYGLSLSSGEELPKYKHFTGQYFKILDVFRLSGVVDENKLKRFCEILSKDIHGERKLRETLWENFIQMAIIGVITMAVMYLAGTFLQTELLNKHLFFHFGIQVFGLIVFIVLINHSRKKLFKDFLVFHQVVQSISFLCVSGMCTQETISVSGYSDIIDFNYKNQQLNQCKDRLIELVRFWLDSGQDIEMEVMTLLDKMSDFYLNLSKIHERRVSAIRLAILSLLYLGSYLINTLILMQTFLTESFYTPV